MKTKSLSIVTIIFLLTSSFSLKSDNVVSIFNFSKTSNIYNWKIINDDVMGGVSNASMKINKDGNATFEGVVSLENNGGFASVRYRFEKIDISNKSTIIIRLKGDEKSYQFRLKSSSDSYYSYIAKFSTLNEWEEVRIPLKELYPIFRGRKLDIPNFSDESIEEISFLIANNKNESFKLIIDKIEIE